ncbi:TIGR04141 family sporadically distributed protein [Lentzea indica]|uniref:TIGR04141 family sporadically distributed protein n=1 Tax=Lentzea indica TaxID=2604800 RepID=UPI00143A7C1D|nr:TIGR04141 family sporadically distributed protein [Lentzea indica]
MTGKLLPTGPATIYRFRAGLPLTDYIKLADGAEVEFDGAMEIANASAHVLAGMRIADEAAWARHPQQVTGLGLTLSAMTPFTVVLVEIDVNWVVAACWGASARHLLDDVLLDESFGLKFGIRRLDPMKLRTLNSSSLDTTSRSKQTSFPLGHPLSGFGLEPAGELVTRLAGSASLEGLTYHTATDGKAWQIRCGNSLHIQLGRSPEDFVADLRAISAIVDSSDADSPLRFLNEVRPVSSNHPLKAELDARLAVALGGDERFGPIGICWPTAVHGVVEEADFFITTSIWDFGSLMLTADFDIDEITTRFARIPEGARLVELQAVRLVPCEDDQGQVELARPISMLKWIAFETSIGDKTFCLQQGRWYELSKDSIDRVNEQLAELIANKSSLLFPVWERQKGKDDEHRYCEDELAKQPGFLCLDQDFAKTPMHPKLELADGIGPGDELIHIKWPSRAAELGHLFNQAQASAWSQRLEPEALQQLREKVKALDSTRTLTDRPRTVVLALGGRPWEVKKIFPLTRVSLLRLNQELTYLGIKLEFADIPSVAKPKNTTVAGPSNGQAA